MPKQKPHPHQPPRRGAKKKKDSTALAADQAVQRERRDNSEEEIPARAKAVDAASSIEEDREIGPTKNPRTNEAAGSRGH